jgi:bifunctional DNA-binding transcriptional regulator/antitoxin component of YhaV-PrlF toxin-antitoxin module
MSLESTVGIAKIGTKSLRATVPEGIVAFLEIQSGDKLEWKMDIEEGERIAIVRKAKTANTADSTHVTKQPKPKRR